SRRRHTRFSRDWSSDVCSSDLADIKAFLRRCHDEWCGILDLPGFAQMLADTPLLNVVYALNKPYFEKGTQQPESLLVVFTTMFKIGRASCRERVSNGRRDDA